MTFAEIEAHWQQCRTREDQRALWEQLARGGWLAASRDAVQGGDRATIEAWLNESDATKREIIHFKWHGEDPAWMVRAHLLCALTALDHQQWTSDTVPTDALQAIQHQLTNPPTHQLSLAFLRDLTQELLGGQGVRAQREATITALLVDKAHNSGVVATLTLELLSDGSGAIFPCVAQAFLPDATFLGAVDNARQYVQRQGLWRDGCDVRWRLSLRRDNRLILTSLTGDSAGLVFVLTLRKLFDPESLELNGVAATGAVDANGRLGKVGGLWEKLGKETMDLAHRRLLHTVVASDGQDDVPPEYLRDDAEPLRVFKAKDVADAVRQLNEQSLPRRAVREYERKECASLDILGESVPIGTHYQALPLLREVKRDDLPRAAMGRGGEREEGREDEDEWSRMRGQRLEAWEESLREKQVSYERHELNEVWSDFRKVTHAASDVPRFVVIGSPGGGKTTLEQYLAWVCSQPRSERSERSGVVRSQPRSDSGVACSDSGVASVETALRFTPCLTTNTVPARVRLREWEAWATAERERPNVSLADYLAERCRQNNLSPAPTAAQWQRWLQRGEVLLLLDGLDEIAGNKSFVDALKSTLSTLKDCPTVLTCRTVSFEQHKAVCPDFPVFMLSGLEDSQRDAFIRAFPASNPVRSEPRSESGVASNSTPLRSVPDYEQGGFDPDTLIAQINRTPQMRPLAANPLLLSILCFVVDRTGIALPARRSELYDKAVDELLDPPASLRRVEVTYPDNNPMPVSDKRRLPERAALSLFAGMDDQRQLTFDEGSLLDALTDAAREEGYGSAPRPYANALLRDLTENRGLLRGSREGGYFFLHLTLQEFLTASVLARWVNDTKTGWDTSFEAAGKRWTVRQFVDAKSWDSRYEEVIILLAGMLKDPVPLLELLSDPQNDDAFRSRLCLAARCLPELKSEIRNPKSEIRNPKFKTASSVSLRRSLTCGGTPRGATPVLRTSPAACPPLRRAVRRRCFLCCLSACATPTGRCGG